MNGYKDLPDETAEALSGDWLHTGDVGRFDDEGFLYIVDRTKDMVITGGFNVFPREVEDVISHAPGGQHASWSSACPTPSGARRSRPSWCCSPGTSPSDELTHELQEMVKRRQGLAAVAEVDRLRRLAPAHRGRQARQEGDARPVLDTTAAEPCN